MDVKEIPDHAEEVEISPVMDTDLAWIGIAQKATRDFIRK